MMTIYSGLWVVVAPTPPCHLVSSVLPECCVLTCSLSSPGASSKPFPHLDCPSWDSSAYWNHTLETCSDATSSLKPYPVPKGQSSTLSTLGSFSFAPLLWHRFYPLWLIATYMLDCPGGCEPADSGDLASSYPGFAPFKVESRQVISHWAGMCVLYVHLHQPMKILLSPLCIWRIWVQETLSKFPKFTQLLNLNAEIQTRSLWQQSLESHPITGSGQRLWVLDWVPPLTLEVLLTYL